MKELDHVFGFKVLLKQTKGGGFYLEGPNGQRASIGDSGGALLSPRDEEVIRDNWSVLDCATRAKP